MKRFAGSVVLAVTMLLVPVSSNATLITLSGILSGANESPVVLTPATGFAQVTLDTVAQTLHIVLSSGRQRRGGNDGAGVSRIPLGRHQWDL
ncbi:MAG: hypothetical protein E6H66_13750 [Betaproteobacteria bacterium]|nr:MAG: hypothetical protein E6H66_13750 [Betaproteobacteria bacterium]